MVGLGAWLGELGLAKYQAVFDEHEIDLAVLPELSEADLEKLGIPMGPRKKLLRAIAQLQQPGASEASDPAEILRSRSAIEGERRQVTVLFADLAGSTALVRRLSAEQANDLLRETIESIARAVRHFEGTVNKIEGDGLMAIFGAPWAQEDHAVRACRAALAIEGIASAVTQTTLRANVSGTRITPPSSTGTRPTSPTPSRTCAPRARRCRTRYSPIPRR
jgi:hypothetical protein